MTRKKSLKKVADNKKKTAKRKASSVQVLITSDREQTELVTSNWSLQTSSRNEQEVASHIRVHILGSPGAGSFAALLGLSFCFPVPLQTFVCLCWK